MSKDTTRRREKAAARREAAALCAKLRERGDALSLDAAAMIEGTLEAFAGLVDHQHSLRDRADNTERNLRTLQDLWAKVPAEERHRAAHGGRRAA